MNYIKIKSKTFKIQIHQTLLLNNNCSAILPVSRVDDYYIFSTTGYISLRNIKEVSENEALSILKMFVSAIEQLKDYLFYPEDYVISPDTIYVSNDNRDVKFLLIPSTVISNEDQAYLSMIFNLFSKTNKNGKIQLKSFYNFIQSNHGYADIMKYLENI